MKIIVTESQYKIIKEQYETIPGRTTQLVKSLGGEGKFTIHTALQGAGAVASLATGGLGFVLPIIFGATDAALYYNEGDTKSATIVGTLSMLPFIGSVIPKIPGVKELGAKGMALLAGKLSSGAKLTKSELQIVNAINSNKSLITQELKTASTKLKPITESVKKLRPKFISKFGQQKYDELLEQFISGKLNKDEFLKTLSSTKKTGVVQGIKGVVMTADEISKISNMSQKIANGQKPSGILQIKVGNSVEDVVINFVEVENNTVAVAGLTDDWGKKLTINVKNLPKDVEDIKRVIYHEITHMKDPTPQILTKTKGGEYYVKGSGTNFADDASELMDKARTIEKNTPKGQKLPKEYYDLKNQADELFSKYEYAPMEKTANFQMIYNSIPDKINSIIKNYSSKFGKKRALDTLNVILNYFKGSGGNIENIIGKRQVEYINKLKTIDSNQYNNLVKKIFQEVENVKAQL